MSLVEFNVVLERIRRWVLASRRSPETWLVTKGHILKPPFSVTGELQDDCLVVSLTGCNDSLTVNVNSAVAGEFRPQLAMFLLDENRVVRDYHVVAPLSRNMQVILEAFPPNSRFSTEQLYSNITWAGDPARTQAHARRRWKELKYSYGLDVDWDGKMYWRGPSPVPVREPELRPDDSKLRKRFWAYLANESAKVGDQLPHCAYCAGRAMSRGDEDAGATHAGIGLIDHRRPVHQGGDDSVENLQILSQTCNNLKNSTCRRCPYGHRCNKCIWAYPEIAAAKRLTLYLDEELLISLTAMAKGRSLDLVVIDILRDTVSESS